MAAFALASCIAVAGQATGAPAQSTTPQAATPADQQQQQQAPGTASAEESESETLAPTPFTAGPSVMIGMAADYTLSNSITTTGGVYPQFATRGGSAEIGVRDQLGDMTAVEFRYAMGTNSQTFGPLSRVETRLSEYTADVAITLPPKGPIRAYFLAGPGLIDFAPTSNGQNTAGATGQVKFSATYGAGIDYKLTPSIALRAEYRGVFYKTPDFNVPNATFTSWSHMAMPTVMIVYHF